MALNEKDINTTVTKIDSHAWSSDDNEKNGVQQSQVEVDPAHTRSPLTHWMSLTAMAFLWTGAQIEPYLYGAVPPYIEQELGGEDRWIWFVLANLLALAAVCPFVGSLSDLIGRRYVAILGATFVCLGVVVGSTAQTMNIFICGMALAGVGAGINELTALAVVSEMAPVRLRGTYVSVLIFTIIPFCPSVLWGQLIAYYGSWRYIGVICGVWNFIGLALTALFYFPPARVNSEGLSRMDVFKQIDFVGGFLSIVGFLTFTAGLQWGGYQYPWGSAHVLAPLLIGAAFIAGFVFWELYGAKYPMFPRRLGRAPRTLALTLVITFVSGANFFSILMFWPTQSFNVYGHDPVAVGLRGIPVGFSILAGACIVLVLLSVFRGHNRALMIVSSILMTAGIGSLAIADTTNLYQLWGLLILAGLGIGGIVVPASIITTIICPSDIIATITALTLAIRVIGGAFGYCIYYNVFIKYFIPNAVTYIGGAMYELGIEDPAVIGEVIGITGAGLIQDILLIPGIDGNTTKWDFVVAAGQLAYAESYKYVYLTSIAFGAIAIVASCFLGDITQFMDDTIAVVM